MPGRLGAFLFSEFFPGRDFSSWQFTLPLLVKSRLGPFKFPKTVGSTARLSSGEIPIKPFRDIKTRVRPIVLIFPDDRPGQFMFFHRAGQGSILALLAEACSNRSRLASNRPQENRHGPRQSRQSWTPAGRSKGTGCGRRGRATQPMEEAAHSTGWTAGSIPTRKTG